MGHLLKEDIRVEKQKVVLRARIISWHRTSHSQFCKNSFSFVVQFLILGLCDYLSVISLQDRELQEDWCRGCFATIGSPQASTVPVFTLDFQVAIGEMYCYYYYFLKRKLSLSVQSAVAEYYRLGDF